MWKSNQLPKGVVGHTDWTEEDNVDWVEKCLRGEFGEFWKEFVEDLQEKFSENLLNAVDDKRE